MVVISNPTPIENEINLIHQLFEEGLSLFHVKKPDYSEEEMKSFLSKIEMRSRSKLVLHKFHHLAEEFGIHRIHFMEKIRTETTEESFKKWKEKGYRLTTSVHSITAFNKLSNTFDYAFFGPIFESISKPNYASDLDFKMELKNRENNKTALIALGGIKSKRIKIVLEYGFDDVALLGTIWNSNNPIENFKACQQIAHLY